MQKLSISSHVKGLTEKMFETLIFPIFADQSDNRPSMQNQIQEFEKKIYTEIQGYGIGY